MVVILGQQYNVGERSPPLYCTLTLIAMQGHQRNIKNKNNVVHTSSNMVVIIYCYIIGCKDKATKWHLNGFPDGSNLRSFIIGIILNLSFCRFCLVF